MPPPNDAKELVQEHQFFGNARKGVTYRGRPYQAYSTVDGRESPRDWRRYEVGPSDEVDDGSAPVRDASWVTVSQLMIADIVGAGILSLGGAMAKMGWLLGGLALVLMFPLNVYTGLMLWEGQRVWPGSIRYGSLVGYCFGSTWARLASDTLIAVCIGSISASPTASPLRGDGRAGTQE